MCWFWLVVGGSLVSVQHMSMVFLPGPVTWLHRLDDDGRLFLVVLILLHHRGHRGQRGLLFLVLVVVDDLLVVVLAVVITITIFVVL